VYEQLCAREHTLWYAPQTVYAQHAGRVDGANSEAELVEVGAHHDDRRLDSFRTERNGHLAQPVDNRLEPGLAEMIGQRAGKTVFVARRSGNAGQFSAHSQQVPARVTQLGLHAECSSLRVFRAMKLELPKALTR